MRVILLTLLMVLGCDESPKYQPTIEVFDNIKSAGWVPVLIILLIIVGLSLIIRIALRPRAKD